MKRPPLDPSVCPLCERPNECELAAGKGHCWCFDLSLSPARPSAADSNKTMPEDVCLCQACLKEGGRSVTLKTMGDAIRRWR
ncbi:MAG: cysteine-rich CWC family protein [Nitrospira sp.]|nr:cysteine-rich CWC family protein [Nitrospira sp.]MCP9460689.1 cysteine-rich CWC family protein [Nitrospira sp.]MCP9473127.1 cysteine-rich CWC family protein [Nitrospira sp.]MCP9474573.1 cysteine-rich CWC family protein [Nitrospira sp.]